MILFNHHPRTLMNQERTDGCVMELVYSPNHLSCVHRSGGSCSQSGQEGGTLGIWVHILFSDCISCLHRLSTGKDTRSAESVKVQNTLNANQQHLFIELEGLFLNLEQVNITMSTQASLTSCSVAS